jgi:HTH-type transcriptional regulator/antitoxin HigA
MNTDAKTPGQLINDLLAGRGWTKRVLAVILGMDETGVNRLASDKREVTADIALALEDVFGVSADKFLELQHSYSLAMARIAARPDPERSNRAHIYSALPITAMIKRGWLDAESVKQTEEVESALCKFFQTGSLGEIEILPHAAKKTAVAADTTAVQLAWLYRVRKIASEMVLPPYTQTKGKDALEKLRPLMVSAEAARKVPRILAEAGIRFVIVESLPSAKIDGVCMWLDSTSPVIGMSLRFDRIDNFWFVLRHELEHVLCGHGQDAIVVDAELEGDRKGTGDNIPEEERIANHAGSEFSVPKRKMDAFIARKDPIYSERDLLGFARSLGVHPGLIVGQLQYRTERYNLFRAHLVKVRSEVTSGAIVDGWGTIAPVDL